MEILKGKEPITQIARKHQVSDALMHRWRERFGEGGKAALNFESGATATLDTNPSCRHSPVFFAAQREHLLEVP